MTLSAIKGNTRPVDVIQIKVIILFSLSQFIAIHFSVLYYYGALLSDNEDSYLTIAPYSHIQFLASLLSSVHLCLSLMLCIVALRVGDESLPLCSCSLL